MLSTLGGITAVLFMLTHPVVFSFVGVILIARPAFMFGRQAEDMQGGGGEHAPVVTAAQRLGAVG